MPPTTAPATLPTLSGGWGRRRSGCSITSTPPQSPSWSRWVDHGWVGGWVGGRAGGRAGGQAGGRAAGKFVVMLGLCTRPATTHTPPAHPPTHTPHPTPSPLPPARQAVEGELVARQMRQLAESERGGAVALLQRDAFPDLARMLALFRRVDGGADLLRAVSVCVCVWVGGGAGRVGGWGREGVFPRPAPARASPPPPPPTPPPPHPNSKKHKPTNKNRPGTDFCDWRRQTK